MTTSNAGRSSLATMVRLVAPEASVWPGYSNENGSAAAATTAMVVCESNAENSGASIVMELLLERRQPARALVRRQVYHATRQRYAGGASVRADSRESRACSWASSWACSWPCATGPVAAE